MYCFIFSVFRTLVWSRTQRINIFTSELLILRLYKREKALGRTVEKAAEEEYWEFLSLHTNTGFFGPALAMSIVITQKCS